MKDIETLKRLAANPFYQMSDEEITALKEAERNTNKSQKTSSKTKIPNDERQTTKGAAPVKETGKLDIHPNDPI